jgi:hypothetical protein
MKAVRHEPVDGLPAGKGNTCVAAEPSSEVSTTENLIPASVNTRGILVIASMASSSVERTSAWERCAISRRPSLPGRVIHLTTPELDTAFTR